MLAKWTPQVNNQPNALTFITVLVVCIYVYTSKALALYIAMAVICHGAITGELISMVFIQTLSPQSRYVTATHTYVNTHLWHLTYPYCQGDIS